MSAPTWGFSEGVATKIPLAVMLEFQAEVIRPRSGELRASYYMQLDLRCALRRPQPTDFMLALQVESLPVLMGRTLRDA